MGKVRYVELHGDRVLSDIEISFDHLGKILKDLITTEKAQEAGEVKFAAHLVEVKVVMEAHGG